MRRFRPVFLILLLVLVSGCSGPTVDRGDLIIRDGLFYEKFSTVPFNGRTKGAFVGKIVDGTWDKTVFEFDLNGQLIRETDYARGIRHGRDLLFSNGDLREESFFVEGELTSFKKYKLGYVVLSETFKNGKPHGQWEYFHLLGDLMFQITFDEGKPIETELDVFDHIGVQYVVPIFYDTNEPGRRGMVADGVVRVVGDDACAVKYIKGASPKVLVDRDNGDVSPAAMADSSKKCLEKVSLMIDYSPLRRRSSGGLKFKNGKPI